MKLFKYIKNISLYFEVILVSLFLSFSISGTEAYASENLMLTKRRSEDDIYLFNVNLGGEILDTIVVFVDIHKDGEKQIFVPVQEFFDVLEISAETDIDQGVSKGWIVSEDRTFTIDLKEGLVRSKKGKVKLNSSIAEIQGSDIYLDSKLFFEFLPIQLTPDFQNLELAVESSEDLPLQVRIENYKRRSEFRKKPTIRLEETDYIVNNDWFTLPFIDLSSSYSLSESKSSGEPKTTNENYNYSFTGRNIMFTMDSEWMARKQAGQNKLDAEFRARKYFYDDRHRPLGPVKQIEVGDTGAYGISEMAGGGQGRGAKISSFFNVDASRVNSVDIGGFLNDGWEVELYKGKTLIDFLEIPVNGRYDFNNIPTTTGINDFVLVFYGPQGQIRKESRQFLIGEQSVGEGEFGFEFSETQDKRYLFEHDEGGGKGEQSQKDTSTVLNTYYGLTDNFLVMSGLASFVDPGKTSTSTTEQDIETDFFNLGFRTLLPFASLQYLFLYSLEHDNFAHEFNMGFTAKSLKHFGLNVKYQLFDKVKTNNSSHFGQFVYDYTEARLNSNLPITKALNFPFELRMSKASAFDDRKDAYEFSGRVSHNLLHLLAITFTGKRTRSYTNSKVDSGTLLLNKRFKKFGIRMEANQEFQPDNKLESVSATVDYNHSAKTKSIFKWTQNYSYSYDENNVKTKDTLDAYSAGVNHMTDHYGSFGTEVSWNTNDNQSISLNYSIGLGYDTDQNKVLTNSRGFSDSGLTNVRVFLDENENGEMDEGEEPIGDVRFEGEQIRTNEKGIATVKNVPPYVLSSVSVREGMIDDNAFLKAKQRNYYYVARPGSIITVDIPIVRVGDIEGEIFDVKGGEMRRIKVSLIDKDGNVIREAKTDIFGFFNFSAIPLGTYKVRLDNDQLKKMKYRPAGPWKVTVDKDEPIYFMDPIVLKKDTKEIAREIKSKKFDISWFNWRNFIRRFLRFFGF